MKLTPLHSIIGLIILAVVLVGVTLYLSNQTSCRDFTAAEVVIGEHTFQAAVAETSAEHTKGLQGCAELPGMSGMYFVYEEARDVRFWMKGMEISLDIIWIRDGKVIGIERNAPPADRLDERPPIYQPAEEVTGVFEVVAGTANELGITAGDAVTLTQ